MSLAFATQAINLVSPFTPVFDPTLFGRHGKVMDSWESQRHNAKPYEEVGYNLHAFGSILCIIVYSSIKVIAVGYWIYLFCCCTQECVFMRHECRRCFD